MWERRSWVDHYAHDQASLLGDAGDDDEVSMVDDDTEAELTRIDTEAEAGRDPFEGLEVR